MQTLFLTGYTAHLRLNTVTLLLFLQCFSFDSIQPLSYRRICSWYVFAISYTNCYSIESITLGTCRIFSDPFVNDFNGRRQTTPNRPQTLTLSEYTNRWKVEGIVSYSSQHHANILQDVVITLFDIDDNTIISIDSKKNVKVSK